MENNNLKMFFSLISGDIYYVEKDEVKNLDETQIPLKKRPNSNCKKCYGRFYTGIHKALHNGKWHQTNYAICPKCKDKCVDWDALKTEEVKVAAPRTTNELANDMFNDALNEITTQ